MSVALSVQEARDLTVRIQEAADRLWALLLHAHEQRAWAALGYASWREYVTAEFGMSERHSYRLLDQGRVIRELETATGLTRMSVGHREAQDVKPAFEISREFGMAVMSSRRLFRYWSARLDKLDKLGLQDDGVLNEYQLIRKHASELVQAWTEHNLRCEHALGELTEGRAAK